MRQYYVGVGIWRQLRGALICFVLALLCLAVVLEPNRHSIFVLLLCVVGFGLSLFLATGAVLNACRVSVAKFRIFFGWRN